MDRASVVDPRHQLKLRSWIVMCRPNRYATSGPGPSEWMRKSQWHIGTFPSYRMPPIAFSSLTLKERRVIRHLMT